jgi:hypothetical protein
MHIQVNVDRSQFIHRFDEVLEGSSQTVDSPNRNEIEIASGGSLQQRIQRGPLATMFGAADPFVLKSFDDRPVAH